MRTPESPEIGRQGSSYVSELRESPMEAEFRPRMRGHSAVSAGASGSSSIGSLSSTPSKQLGALDLNLSEISPPRLERSPPKVPTVRTAEFSDAEVAELLAEDSYMEHEEYVPREVRLRAAPRASTPTRKTPPIPFRPSVPPTW